VESLKTNLLGVVLNQVPLNAGGDYGYYTSNYAYYSEPATAKARRGPAEHAAPSAAAGPAQRDRLVLREPEKK
jgi:hypothetical protein